MVIGWTGILFRNRLRTISLTALIWSALACSNISCLLFRLASFRVASKKGRCLRNQIILPTLQDVCCNCLWHPSHPFSYTSCPFWACIRSLLRSWKQSTMHLHVVFYHVYVAFVHHLAVYVFSWSLVYFSSSTFTRSSLQTPFHTVTRCTRDST